MDVGEPVERIAKAGRSLTPAERRVAEVVVAQPQLVAFGTVAELADAAGSGAATVVRLAGKLGYDGFSGLQSAVQHTLAGRLRPAHERIREPAAQDNLQRHLQLEIENVRGTLGNLQPEVLDEVGGRLAAARKVWVVSGDASRGVALQLVGDLATLRDDVALIDGNPVAVQRMLTGVAAADVVILVDLRRYDRWVLDASALVGDVPGEQTGPWVVAITDRILSPLAAAATRTMVVVAGSGGPFDSHVGTLALFNLIVAKLADRLRAVATERLDRIEAAWQRTGAMTDP